MMQTMTEVNSRQVYIVQCFTHYTQVRLRQTVVKYIHAHRDALPILL